MIPPDQRAVARVSLATGAWSVDTYEAWPLRCVLAGHLSACQVDGWLLVCPPFRFRRHHPSAGLSIGGAIGTQEVGAVVRVV